MDSGFDRSVGLTAPTMKGAMSAEVPEREAADPCPVAQAALLTVCTLATQGVCTVMYWEEGGLHDHSVKGKPTTAIYSIMGRGGYNIM